MKLPSDRPERHFHVSLIGHVLANDTRFGWTVDFVYWRIRFHVNGFLRRCKRAGVSPAAVVAGSNNPEISALFAQREHLDRIILDLLAALPADMRAAEEEGEYSRLMEYFVNKDPDVDPDRIGAHIKTQYIIAIRLLRLEIKSGFGIHTFNEIAEGAMDQEFDGSQSFSECLRESVIYTRHLSSLVGNAHLFPTCRSF